MVFSLQATGTTKPIVIMTTPQVSPRMQKQLATTGARVIEVKHGAEKCGVGKAGTCAVCMCVYVCAVCVLCVCCVCAVCVMCV